MLRIAKVVAPGYPQRDGIGNFLNALNSMSLSLRKIFKDISTGVQTLTSSSTVLSVISEQMASGAEQSSEKANKVSGAAEEMATSMNSVAVATEQTTANLQMIVSVAEEMSATINEIANNTAKGSLTTSDAVTKAEHISRKVDVQSDYQEVIALKHEDRLFGLKIVAPIDTVELQLTLDKSTFNTPLVIGSAIINDNTTLLLDIPLGN
jgi:methyl-accepting chemotaxis protein